MFVFNESLFCTNMTKDLLSDEQLLLIKNIREFYPEIKNWNDSAIYFAWGSYSQDIYAVQWVDWINGIDLGFLAYCYICQVRPSFDFGGTGLFNTEIWELGEGKPWEQKQPVDLPDCFM